MAAQSGFLLLADISGYTSFVTQTELDHAEEILASLIEEIVVHTRVPLQVLELEGDAVFSYAPADGFSGRQTLVDMIEQMYVAFARKRAHINHNNTCTCTACELAPSLDLKFVIHYGTFTFRKYGPHTGMTGQDVILVHRLLKNTICDATGVESYAYFTQAALDAIGLPELAQTMHGHTETYDHLGEVTGYVYDMHAFWLAYQDQQHRYVSEEEAWITGALALPVPPVLAWEYLTQAHYRQHWLGADAVDTFNLQQGRVGVGVVEHCAHGEEVAVNEVVDWRPFEYVTYRSQLPLKGYFYLTIVLEATAEGGAQGVMRVSKPKADQPIRNFLMGLLAKKIAPTFKSNIETSREALQTLIAADAEKHDALMKAMLADVQVMLED